MKLSINVKDMRRKELVIALEEIISVKSEYKGVPTFAFQVGNLMVDINGMLIGEIDSIEGFQNIVKQISSKGFYGEDKSVEVDGTAVELNPTVQGQKEAFEEIAILEIQMPTGVFTPRALENLKRLLQAKGELIKKNIGVDELPFKIERETIGFPWFPLKGDENEVEHHEKCSA